MTQPNECPILDEYEYDEQEDLVRELGYTDSTELTRIRLDGDAEWEV